MSESNFLGPVTCANIPLKNIDTLQPDDESQMCQSALHSIVRLGHLELLSESIILEILRKKWIGFARGHFLLNGLLYVCVVVSFTLLCQHYRHGLVTQGSNEVVLKEGAWSSATCRNDGATLWETPKPDGSVTMEYGFGKNNCVAGSSLDYPGRLMDVEGVVLEVLVFVGAIAFLILEIWDIFGFVQYRARVERLRQRDDIKPPDVPPLYPLPGTIIPKAEAIQMERSKLRAEKVAAGTARGVAAPVPGEDHAGLGGIPSPEHNPPSSWSIAALLSHLRSAGSSTAAAVTAFVSLDYENSSAWAYLAEAHPTTVFIWCYGGVIIYHFAYWASGTLGVAEPELAVNSHMARGLSPLSRFIFIFFVPPFSPQA